MNTLLLNIAINEESKHCDVKSKHLARDGRGKKKYFGRVSVNAKMSLGQKSMRTAHTFIVAGFINY